MKKILVYTFLLLSLFLISSCDNNRENDNNPGDDTFVESLTSKEGISIEFKDEKVNSRYEFVVNFSLDSNDLDSYKSKINDEKEEAILIFDFSLVLDKNNTKLNKDFDVKIPTSLIKEKIESFDETKINNYHLYNDNNKEFKSINFELKDSYILFESNNFNNYVLSYNLYSWTPIIWQ